MKSTLWAVTTVAVTMSAGHVRGVEPASGTIPISGVTAHKPQSKLWFDHGTWWAALPNEKGVWVWRFSDGRFEPQEKPGPLLGTGTNSVCDVVAKKGTAFILADQPGEVPVFLLQFSDGAYRVAPGYPVRLAYPDAAAVMTCDLDSKGKLWVGYVNNTSQEVVVHVLSSENPAGGFSSPQVIAKLSGRGDIAAVVAFGGHIGMMWSDQKTGRFLFRARPDHAPIDQWGPEEVVESGPGVANDHIHLSAAPDGNLWAVTKAQTSAKSAVAHITLRRRNREGKWDRIIRVAPPGQARTRPTLVLSGDGQTAYVIYSGKLEKPVPIYLRRVSLADGKMGPEVELLKAPYSLNNATVSKRPIDSTTGLMVVAGANLPAEGPAVFRLLDVSQL
ncbi:MAG: hypothetical protein N2255_03210 [Kiritimatiellae bacterium]|nr:hypothetical protein [Kiritimatiellia bacterium]